MSKQQQDFLVRQDKLHCKVDRTWSPAEFSRMQACALELGREDFITILYLGRYAALRIHECFRIDTATATKAIKENALTIKGRGGLVRTVPLTPLLGQRLQLHLQQTPRGHKLFVSDDQQTHEAIGALQAFIYLYRPHAQEKGSDRPMTFHGLRHTCAAEWYKCFIQRGLSPYQARKSVSKLLGYGRDDVTRIYLASLGEMSPNSSYKYTLSTYVLAGKMELERGDSDGEK